MNVVKKPRNHVLSQIRANRRGLRLRGLTGGDLLALEACAVVAPTGEAVVSAAAVGRMLGVKRSCASWRLLRLVAAGVVSRVVQQRTRGRGVKSVLRLNVNAVLGLCVEAVKGRFDALRPRWRKWGEKQLVRANETHKEPREYKKEKGYEIVSVQAFEPVLSRSDALAGLREAQASARSVYERRREAGLRC